MLCSQVGARAADLQSVLDQINPESLPSEQLEIFNRRRFKLGERVETPHLDVKYQPTEWGPATSEIPKEKK